MVLLFSNTGSVLLTCALFHLLYRTSTFSGRVFKLFLRGDITQPFPLSFANTYGISVDFFSLSYSDVSFHSVVSFLVVFHGGDLSCIDTVI